MKLIYLIGAGRSGTTILSLMLGNSDSVNSLGELHQLPEHMSLEKSCSCGKQLSNCDYWSEAYSRFHKIFCSSTYQQQARELESHRYVFKYFFKKNRALKYSEYCNATTAFFNQLPDNKHKIDSAKYIGRGLALNSIFNKDIQFVYLVRDPRGVVNSFGKKVQTSRGWLSASIYYLIVNLTAVVVSNTILRNKCVKIRYEDLINNQESTLTLLSERLGINLDEVKLKLNNQKELKTGHVVGGNRLVKEKAVRFRSSDSWESKMPRWKQWTVWLLTIQLNLVNVYKP